MSRALSGRSEIMLRRPLLVLILVVLQCMTALVLRAEPAAPNERPIAAPTLVATEKQLPVILLTGFEPFGPDRPANPSWEGIKGLDGAAWHGYRLASRQMKVVWGQPLSQLQQWIEQLHPVAIFSFGQGGGFALETHARNARGPFVDNMGDGPPTPYVIDGGPEKFRSSLDSPAVLAKLVQDGYDARLSTDAGSYLCEETLYTLEYLKDHKQITGPVSFCHVPSLGATTKKGPVTPELVQAFVKDFLMAWERSSGNGVTPVALKQDKADDQRKEAEVRKLIDRYFASWSNQDLLRYGQCFMPLAAIQLVDESGRLVTLPLAPFLKSQQDSQRQATVPMKETPESVQIHFEGQLARVLVYWKLVDGQRIEYGYDHFTLMRSDGQWKIAHLIFYSVKPKADAAK